MKNELQKHKKSDFIKWIVVFVAIAVLAVSVSAALTKGFTDGNPFGWFDKQKQQPIEQQDDIGGGVIDENGNQLESGKVYPMPANMIFSSASAASETANNGITITATVEPDSATNKTVDWTVVFVNPESAWATGKNATDYIAVTPTADGSLTANVRCLQAFGEKAKIIVISRDNPEAKAECVVDFSQKITGIVLKLGELNVNLGGNTNVTCEVNPNGVGIGGDTNLTLKKGDVYTLEDNFSYTVKLELLSENGALKLLRLNDSGISFHLNEDANGSSDITNSGYYFDFAHEIKRWAIDTRQGEKSFGSMSTSTIINNYFSNITQPEMFDIVVTVMGTHSSYTATSRVICTGYTNQASVTGLSLSNSTIIL